MFGAGKLQTENNTIEQSALVKVCDILHNPAQLSLNIPPLPSVLLQLIHTLKDEKSQFMNSFIKKRFL